MRTAVSWAVLVLVLALAGCSGEPGPTAPPVTPTTSGSPADTTDTSTVPATGQAVPDDLRPEDWVTGLTTPWGIDTFADGSVLLTERDTGRVLRLTPEGEVIELGTVDEEGSGEGGLLGATLNPDERHVYLYVSTAVDNRVVRHALEGDALGPAEEILTGIPVATYHDGGQLRFGQDGMLYVSTGDAGDTMAAQDPDSLAGKILRLTPDGDPAPGNPSGTEVWSLGHRNVQGLAWDAEGRLWASEFGQNSQDELNLIEPGLNYGWPLVEGEGDVDGMTPPVLVWPTSDASPSGLAFWRGSLWMAALRGERLWEIPVTDQDTGQLEPIAHWVGEFGRLRAVASAGDDAPLLVATSNTDGRGNVRAGDDRVMRAG